MKSVDLQMVLEAARGWLALPSLEEPKGAVARG